MNTLSPTPLIFRTGTKVINTHAAAKESNGFRRNPHKINAAAATSGRSVLVSGLTTIAGFGSLVIADHRGISSLGFIMAVGTTTCMVVGLTFLPALLNLLMRIGWRLNKNPGDNNAQLPPG